MVLVFSTSFCWENQMRNYPWLDPSKDFIVQLIYVPNLVSIFLYLIHGLNLYLPIFIFNLLIWRDIPLFYPSLSRGLNPFLLISMFNFLISRRYPLLYFPYLISSHLNLKIWYISYTHQTVNPVLILTSISSQFELWSSDGKSTNQFDQSKPSCDHLDSHKICIKQLLYHRLIDLLPYTHPMHLVHIPYTHFSFSVLNQQWCWFLKKNRFQSSVLNRH